MFNFICLHILSDKIIKLSGTMKVIFKSIILSFLFIGIAILFANCKKDTECKSVITAKLQSDTNIVVSEATIKITKQDIYVEGVTDASGEYRHTFPLEAILDVSITKGSLSGKAILRLKPGETVYKSVFMN